MEDNAINLFQNKVTYSPKLTVIERYLRIARSLFLFGVLGVSVLTLVVYGVFQFQQRSLEKKRQTLYEAVKQEVTKEAMLIALRARVSSLKKIMMYQISIAPYIDTTLLIASPPQLSAFSLGDENSIRIEVQSETVEQAISVVETVMRLTEEKKIKNPVVTSITLDKNGAVMLGFTYFVVL